MKIVCLTFTLLFYSLCIVAEDSATAPNEMQKAKINKASKEKNAKYLNNNRTSIKNPFDLRDPFKRLVSLKLIKEKKKKSFIDGNVFSNLPTIDNVPLSDIEISGILLGKDRRAIAKLKGKKSSATFILREGMKLGEDDAVLKAILPGGIVVVEKIRNVYDQDEYLETIIPVSSN